jgi:hypothetical protein
MILGQQFTNQWQSNVSFQFSCFDRVILTGYLPFWSPGCVNRWIGGGLGILHKDFIPQMKRLSEQLVNSAKQLAAQEGAPFEHLKGRCRKEAKIDRISRKRRDPDGLIAVLCTQESCRTVQLAYGPKRPSFVFAYRQQRVLYFYLNDPQFGRMFVRIQTGFPWRVQVYVNGHDWLARQLHTKGIGFVQRDNAFLSLDDPQAAQRIADQFAVLPWASVLDRFVRQFNPLLSHPWLKGRNYSWFIDQAEYSTDVLFKDRNVLSDLFPRLLDHAVVNFGAQDIMTFLGRRLHPLFEGEVLTRCQKNRDPGARIKHLVANNWLKMYDKFARLLRVETVINNPKGFKVLDTVPGPHGSIVVWKQLGKSVRNFRRYMEIARSSNLRYLDALAPVKDCHPSYMQIGKLVQSQQHAGRSYAGFSVAKKDDVDFFAAVLAGENHLHGFKTEDIRRRLHGDCFDPLIRRRQAQAVSRRLKRLHIRGLIAKVPRSHRWRTSILGQHLMTKVIRLYYNGLSQAA